MNPRTSAKAEAFAAALESGTAVADPAVAALVGLVERLSAVPLRPVPEFTGALRAQLVEAAASPAAPPTPSSTATPPSAPTAPPAAPAAPGVPAWLSGPAAQLATGALAVAVGVVGTGVGASRSLPGDALYGVKRGVERLQLALADDAVDRADALAEHVRTRLDEVSALLDGLRLPLDADTERLVQETLDRLAADIDELTALLLDAAHDGSGRALSALDAFTADARMRLSALAGALPAGPLRDTAHAAVGVVETVATEAAEITATPGSVTPTPVRTTEPTGPSSGRPGTTPTDVPTDLPTDVPSGLPTSLPTELPSSLPSEAPTGLPGELPTTAPTQLPTGVPAVPVPLPSVALPL